MSKKGIRRNIGAYSCNLSIKPHKKEELIEAICEVCDRVYITDEDICICPKCKKTRNIH